MYMYLKLLRDFKPSFIVLILKIEKNHLSHKLVQNKKTHLLGIESKTSAWQRITYTTYLKTIYLKPTDLFTMQLYDIK